MGTFRDIGLATLVMLMLLAVLTGVGHSQPAVGNVGTGTTTGNQASLSTASFAISGTDVVLVACVAAERGASGFDQTASSVSWNTSESLTKLVEIGTGQPDPDRSATSLWYLINPTQTTSTVDVVLVDDSTAAVTGIVLTGIEQVAPPSGLVDTSECTTACASQSVSITTVLNNSMLVACNNNDRSGATHTHGTDQVERSDVKNASASNMSMATSTELKVTAGAETLTVTPDSDSIMQYIAATFEPVVVADDRPRRIIRFR